jgi:polyamine oxidase
MESKSLKAIVIGAGISGLHTAQSLKSLGVSVQILEARSVFGGRIAEDKTFAGIPIELGAEEIHGKGSPHFTLAKSAGAKVSNSSNDYDYIEYEGKLYREDVIIKKEKSVKRALDIEEEDIPDLKKIKDISIGDYVKETKIPENVRHIVFSTTTHEYGGYSSDLSIKGMQKLNVGW